MYEYWTESILVWRIRCAANWEAPECSVVTPRASSRDEARKMAEERGWEFIDGKWCCPSHIQALMHQNLKE